MSVRPLIPTEPTSFSDQFVGQSIVPSDANVNTALLSIGLIAAMGILIAVRNPRYVLPVMTATLGLSIGAGYIAMTRTSTATASTS